MNIISIETATDWCGVALLINDKCEDKIQKKIPRKNANIITVIPNHNFVVIPNATSKLLYALIVFY